MSRKQQFQAYVVLTAFSDKGMEIYGPVTNFEISKSELMNIANYYSVILGISEKEGALYGPLPVAYHLEYLLFLYSFQIQNPHVKDARVKKGDKVPASILIFYPTFIDGYAVKCRKDFLDALNSWSKGIVKVNDFTKEKAEEIRNLLNMRLKKELQLKQDEEKPDTNIVIEKNIQLLETVALRSGRNNISLICAGLNEKFFDLFKEVVLRENYDSVEEYRKIDLNQLYIRLPHLELHLVDISTELSTFNKLINKNTDGILYFADFSNRQKEEKNEEQLNKIISDTKEDCVLCYAISNTKEKLAIKGTKLPLILQKATGRTLSIIDLADEKNTMEIAIIEFIEKVIEQITEY